MKIAIPTRDHSIEDHFGHCKHISIYLFDDDNHVISKEVLKISNEHSCKSNIIEILKGVSVEKFLVGYIGHGAFNMLQSNGIQVIRGCKGQVENILHDFLDGKITDQHVACPSHGFTCDRES